MKHRQANGSLRQKEVQTPNPYNEYFLFNFQNNFKAYSDDVMSFAYYGYNAANTRTYKLSLYNTNLWINGQQQPLHLQWQNAMFYPNTYLNFNQNGEYTKHYYNGMERVASRLGDNSTTIAIDNMLENRKLSLEEQVRNEIQELISETPQVDMPPMLDILNLQPTGTPNDIYYYHPNHLGSTSFVTDQNQTITQGFLYAPFGEITTEYNINFGSSVIPKYSFNAKELDEETGMYYFEARYYRAPTFISRDPLMSEKPWLTPYNYCSNNPIGRVDPSGMMDDWYKNEAGTAVFWREGNEPTIDINGETYHNIGETYSCTQDNVTYNYNQNDLVSMTEHVLNPNDYESQMMPNVPKKKKPGPDGNCFTQAGKMVAKSGTTSYDQPSYNISNPQNGIDYINNQIDKGFSVRVHVDRTNDGVGNHWVAISSRTVNFQTGEISFGFYDPGTRDSSLGTKNTFMIISGVLSGSPSYNTKIKYQVVNVRKNKN